MGVSPANSGDRAEGWLQQSRSLVLACKGIVVTSQPLAQAGLLIPMQYGNAVVAAVPTAAALNVAEPMNVGMGEISSRSSTLQNRANSTR